MPPLSPRLVASLVGGLAVLIFIGFALSWRSERNSLRVWQGEVVAATREASANPKLSKSQVALQIQLLGKDIAQCKGALGRQNEAVAALASETVKQQALAKQAEKRAQERGKGIEATRLGLEASARAPAAQAKPCAPSRALTEAWR